MQPSLWPGDRVVVRPLKQMNQDLQPGMVVVSWHPSQKGTRLIKRLIRIEAGGLWLEGDNPLQSTDSRQLGIIPRDCLIGAVVGRFSLNRDAVEESRSKQSW